MPNMSSGFRHIFGCIYMYIYMCGYAANFVLQVAVVVVSVFVLVSLFGFGIWVENEFNMLSPTTST